VSPTKLKTFGDCAHQFHYKYVLELEGDQYSALTTLGSVFHYALEVYEQYNYDLGLAIRTFRHYWANPEQLGLRIDFYPPRMNHVSLEQNAVDMLERYHELRVWRGGELIGTEIKFEVPLGNHILVGIIDKLWLRRQKQQLQVIDFKTGYKVAKKLRLNLQFTSYMYATTRPEFWAYVPGWEDAWESFQDYERTGQWFHARQAKAFNAGTRTDLDYRRLLLAADQMERAIEHDIYPLTIEGEICGWCPWVEICGTEVSSPVQEGIAHAVQS
jgi:hypothetical protein